MKYARVFEKHLSNDGFPQEWVNSAISYGQLKKCVKRVQQELTALGLDVGTLRQLLATAQTQSQAPNKSQESVEKTTSPTGTSPTEVNEGDDGLSRSSSTSSTAETPFQYKLSSSSSSPLPTNITPQLLFVVDAVTGEPLSAGLSSETREYLQHLAVTSQLTDLRIAEDDQSEVSDLAFEDRAVRYVQVPLTTDSEFFSVLEKELTGLVELQAASRKKLTDDIHAIGRDLDIAATPSSRKGRHDLTQWRTLLECYLDARVFFATNERDHGSRKSGDATKNWQEFMENAKKAKVLDGWKKKESVGVLERFFKVNWELIQVLKFREINNLAMVKILKKFDKRTALGASSTFSHAATNSLLSDEFSRALAGQVASEIISVVPQLDDFLCPICFTIAYRPVRLRCGHLFCIRCMILLQRSRKDQCALCREPAVLEADSRNLDKELMKFLQKYFPAEVKAKQKAVGKAMAIEQFNGQPCMTM